ncbi:zinc finger protein 318 [Trichonephila clavata]|uniref:Zinc finger protein 318 n=1 Tax=Trichonephila clavata TaxID=2740835 RepID=A0A8X6GYM3_TRICU|nr:zinc finger protein 318 [Trichonephila clavata]
MARYPNTTPLRGILRDTDRNLLQSFQQRTTYDSQQVNSRDKEINYSSVNEANMPIFADVESSIPSSSFKSGIKSQSINADLYAQAMAAKSDLGLLDTTPFSSSLAALQDYGNFKSHSAASQKKLLTSPFQSMVAQNVVPYSPASHSPIDLQNETPLSYKNTNTEKSAAFKSIMDLNLNTVEDEDEFLYGEANLLPDTASFNQGVDFNTQTNSTDAYMSDDELQGIEAPNFRNSLSSVEEKLNNSTWKKASGWDIKDDTVNSSVNINTVKPCEKEPSLFSKQHRVDSEAHCYSPLEQNSNDYNKLSMLFYKSQEKTRQSQYPEASFELLKTTPSESTAFASYANISLSPPNFFTFLSENKNMHVSSSNFLKKQPNNRGAKNGSIYQDKVNYENVSIVDKTKHSYEQEESVDKSISKESVNFPKLLINVEQDRISTRRIVHMSSPSKLENQPSSYNNVRMKNFESVNEVLKSKTIETRRVVCNESKNNTTKIAILDHKDEAYSVNLNNDIHSLETSKKEQISNVVSDKYCVKQGDKSCKQRSPEWHMSPSCGSRGRSPESIRRRSPSHKYRSRDYSPYYRHHDRSPNRSHYDSSRYRPRDHSPRYHSRGSPDRRSPGHSSRSRERSPRRRNRYHSRSGSPKHSSLEKRSYSPQDQSPVQYPSSEKCSRPKGNTSPEPITKNVLKRTRVFVSDELTDKHKSFSPRKIVTSLEEKLGVHTDFFSETVSKNSDEIASKRGKIDDIEGVFQNPLHSSENNMNSVKIISNSSITVPSVNESEIQLDLPEADAGFSTNDKDLNVATTTSWAAITRPPVPISSSSQLNMPNTFQYGISYPQQAIPILPHMYPQYTYGTPSVLPLPDNIIYNPMVPPPLTTTTPFTYPPMPTCALKTMAYKNRCLKEIPMVNSVENINLPKSETTQSQSQEDPPTAKFKNKAKFKRKSVLKKLPKSETAKSQSQEDPLERSQSKSPTAKFKRNVVLNNKASHMQDSIEDNKGLVQRYRKLLEERDIMLKTLRNTSDHTVEIRNLKMDLEKKVKTSRAAADKMLVRTCTTAFEKANEKLNRYIEEAKRLNADVKELQSKISPKLLQNISTSSEKTEKQRENTLVSYFFFDSGDHWCAECNEKFSSIPKAIEHLHQKTHLQYEDPFKIVATEPVKEDMNKRALLEPAKGVEFIKPLCGFYCSLCKESLVNQAYAEKHVKGTDHMINYKNFLMENPVYEEKRAVFKKVASITSVQVKKLKDVKGVSKCLIQENQKLSAEALKKMSDESQEKLLEKLEESNINVKRENQKGGGLKLKLTNEKTNSLETNTIKVPDVKPKQTVVYIGRAPNYKPRTKSNDKNSFLEKKKKAVIEKVEEEYDYDSFYAVSDKTEKQSCSVLQPLDSASLDSKNLDSLPISKIFPKGVEEIQAKDISCEKEPSKTKLDESNSNDKTKQVVCSKKNKTVSAGCLSEAEAKNLDSESASKKSDQPIEHQTNEHFMNEASKNTNNEISISQGDINLSEIELPPKISFPEKNIEIPKAPPEPKRRYSLTEEEEDFLLLGIDKSDMEPIAVPRPPPSALIQNHSDVANLPPFPPPLQVPPPNIVSQVPPPTIAPFVPPPNIISSVPPPNIISSVPPPNIAAQIPPPNIAAQIPPPSIASNSSPPDIVVPTWNFTSEQNHFNPVFFTETSILSHKIYPSVSEQPQTHIPPEDQNTDVIDMEIDDTDEIEFGSDYLIEKEGIPCCVKPSDNVSASKQSAVVPIIEELPASSLSSISLIATESQISPTSANAPIVLEGNEIVKQNPKSATSEQENENDFSEVVIDNSDVDDDRIMLRELLNLLMDAVAAELNDSEKDKAIHNKKAQVSVLPPVETTESYDSRNNQSNSICIDSEREDFERADNPNNFHVQERIVVDDKSDERSNSSLTEKFYNMNWTLTANSSDDQNNNSDGLLNEKLEENASKASPGTVSSKEVEIFNLSQNTTEEMPELTGEILNAVISITNDELNHSFAHTTEFQEPEHSALSIDGISTAQEGNEMDTDIYVEECSINQKLSDCSSNFSNSYCAANERLENAENSNEKLFDSLSSFSNFVDSLKNKELKNESNSTEILNNCSPNFLNYRNGSVVNKDSENEGNSKDICPETVYLKVENTSTNVSLPQNRKEGTEVTDEMQNNSTVPFYSKVTQSSNGAQVNSPQADSTLKNENKEVDDDLEIIAEYDCRHKSQVKGKKRRSIHEIIELDSEPEEMEIKEVKENSQGIPCVNFTCISEINNDQKQTSSFINLYSQRSIIKEQHISAFNEMEALTSTPTTSEIEKAYNTSKRNESFDENPQKSLDNTQEIFLSKETNQIVKDNESFLNLNEKLINKDVTCQEKVIASINEMPHGESSVTHVNTQFEQNHSDNLCFKQENVTSNLCEPENEKSPERILMQNDSPVSSLGPSNNDKKVQHAQNLEISNGDDMHYSNELSLAESSGSSSIVTTYGENVKFVIKKEEENSEEETIRNEIIMHSNFRDSKDRTAAQENRTPGCKNVSSNPLPFIKVEIKSEETAEIFMNETTKIGGYIATPCFPLKMETKEEKNDICMEFFDESMQQNLTHSLDKGFTVVRQKCFQGSTSHFNESKALEMLNDNSQELKREVSVPLLKKYDTDEILSDMSADGPPILSERDESSSQHNRKDPNDSDSVTKAYLFEAYEAEENEQKKKERKNDSDTDEYETED